MHFSIGWPSLWLAIASSCTLLASEATLPRGVWGGDSIVLEVVTGGADLEFDCARGRISEPLKLDGKGTFVLPGTFAPEGPGPTRDDAPPPAPARYQGSVKGDTMTLSVVRGEQQIGTFKLTRGRQTVLRKCR